MTPFYVPDPFYVPNLYILRLTPFMSNLYILRLTPFMSWAKNGGLNMPPF